MILAPNSSSEAMIGSIISKIQFLIVDLLNFSEIDSQIFIFPRICVIFTSQQSFGRFGPKTIQLLIVPNYRIKFQRNRVKTTLLQKKIPSHKFALKSLIILFSGSTTHPIYSPNGSMFLKIDTQLHSSLSHTIPFLSKSNAGIC